jgi:predicted Rossmann fold nucleotide-binding protein DprA/Smf involved in DNA uptake
VLSPSDILEYYGIPEQEISENKNFQSWEREILHMLAQQPVHMSELAQRTGMCQTDLMRKLARWKKEGRVREVSRGYFVR